MPKSITGHELVGSTEELARAVISCVVPDARDAIYTNEDGERMVGIFTALRIIKALEADGFIIERRK